MRDGSSRSEEVPNGPSPGNLCKRVVSFFFFFFFFCGVLRSRYKTSALRH